MTAPPIFVIMSIFCGPDPCTAEIIPLPETTARQCEDLAVELLEIRHQYARPNETIEVSCVAFESVEEGTSDVAEDALGDFSEFQVDQSCLDGLEGL
jgi:hypothetical protein